MSLLSQIRTRLRGSTGRPVRVVNDQPGFWPGGAHVSPVGSLPVLLKLARVTHEVEQRQISLASSRLDGRQEQTQMVTWNTSAK
jgi:hypothetical protein